MKLLSQSVSKSITHIYINFSFQGSSSILLSDLPRRFRQASSIPKSPSHTSMMLYRLNAITIITPLEWRHKVPIQITLYSLRMKSFLRRFIFLFRLSIESLRRGQRCGTRHTILQLRRLLRLDQSWRGCLRQWVCPWLLRISYKREIFIFTQPYLQDQCQFR